MPQTNRSKHMSNPNVMPVVICPKCKAMHRTPPLPICGWDGCNEPVNSAWEVARVDTGTGWIVDEEPSDE